MKKKKIIIYKPVTNNGNLMEKKVVCQYYHSRI